MKSILVFAKSLDSFVPFLNEIQIRINPFQVFIDILWKWVHLEQFRIQPHLHFRIIIRYAILQEEEIDIALEIDEHIEELPILLQAP